MRKLVLKKETLTELRLEDLRLVAGAAATTPVAGCATTVASKIVECATDSVLRPCITHTCTL